MPIAPRIIRIADGQVELARETFTMMANVFEEGAGPLRDEYLTRILARKDFWALAALLDGKAVGGITAHTLPMTRSETSELFIYDLAVASAHQRQGIGSHLVNTLRTLAAAEGISVAFVPADSEDLHALEFYRTLGADEAPVTIFSFE